MTEIIFERKHAEEAIAKASKHGEEWLYQNYPKPGGNRRNSTTGFLVYRGEVFPVKPLGRLANEIAGMPMTTNPKTGYFRARFAKQGFQLIDSPTSEADAADNRQKAIAEVWQRPNQAEFRSKVFQQWGAKCVVTGCDVLGAIEAAHIVPFSEGGQDGPNNGLPLRADIHRLFDAGLLVIRPGSLKAEFAKGIGSYYRDFEGTRIKISKEDDIAIEAVSRNLKRRLL
ncbi:MAG: HNH endonuclease [Sphingomonadaceae bacterium]